MDQPHQPLIPTRHASATDAGASEPRGRLDRALVHSLAWTGGVRWTAQIATWLATILVARMLVREDFGIWTSAQVYLGIVILLSEFGIGASVVIIRDLTERQTAQVNGFAVLTGTTGMLLSWVLARPIAAFYQTSEIAGVITAMSVLFVISSFRIVPLSLMQRDLRFKRLAIIGFIRALTQAGVLVAAAALGFRYWTLVIGALAGETAWTLMILGHQRCAFAWPRFVSIRRSLSFSTNVVVARLSWYFYSNSDFVLAGRLLGQDALGAYGLASTLARVAFEKISAIVVSVTPAFFSAVQKRPAELRRYLLSLTEGISLLSFPTAIGMALVADSFVAGVLGPHWQPAVAPLQILAAYTAVRSIAALFTPILLAVGETRFVAWSNIFALVLMPTVFLIGTRWGIVGVAAGWLVAHPVILAALFWRVSTRIALPVGDYGRSLWPAASGTVLMAAVVLATKLTMPATVPAVGALLATVIAGGLTYAAVLLLFHRSRVRAFRATLARVRTPDSGGDSARPPSAAAQRQLNGDDGR